MPTDGRKDAPQDRPADASKKPGGASRAKSDERQVRLAEALRANLRRRKVSAGKTDKKDT